MNTNTAQAIKYARGLDESATKAQITQAGNRLLRCNLVTAPTVIESWIGAWQHLERLQRALESQTVQVPTLAPGTSQTA